MNRSSKWLLAALATITASPTLAAPPQKPLSIRSATAFPYYPASGKIDQSINLADRRVALWNAIAGGGDVKAETTVTFVDVLIEGDSERVLHRGSVKLNVSATARGAKQPLLRQTLALETIHIENPGTWHVPVFVYGTGCEPLEVNIVLTVDGKPQGRRSISVPFKCGE